MQSNEMWLLRSDNEELGTPQQIIDKLKIILPELTIQPPVNKYKKILEAKKAGLKNIQIECIKNSPPEYEGYYENELYKISIFIQDIKIVPSFLVFVDPIESNDVNTILDKIEKDFEGKFDGRDIGP